MIECKEFVILKECAIAETQDTDYPYRIIASKQGMSVVISSLLNSIDYTNFKDEVHDTMPLDSAYNNFLMNTWSVGLHMQEGN